MELVLIQDFGFRKAGDTVIVPDGDEFSPVYFRLADSVPDEPELKDIAEVKEESFAEPKVTKPRTKAAGTKSKKEEG